MNNEKLCDPCGIRPGNYHFFTGGEDEARSYCPACFELYASPDQKASVRGMQKAVRAGKCQYCGAQADCGSGSNDEGSAPDFWCKACRKDLAEFRRLPENNLLDDLSDEFPNDEAEIERLNQRAKEREKRQIEFIRRKVAERQKLGS
jgi:hypothetical protein